jgi:hypothetical protein
MDVFDTGVVESGALAVVGMVEVTGDGEGGRETQLPARRE